MFNSGKSFVQWTLPFPCVSLIWVFVFVATCIEGVTNSTRHKKEHLGTRARGIVCRIPKDSGHMVLLLLYWRHSKKSKQFTHDQTYMSIPVRVLDRVSMVLCPRHEKSHRNCVFHFLIRADPCRSSTQSKFFEAEKKQCIKCSR